MFLCDFHIHSTFSDGKLSIPEIVDFYGVRGFGAIAITDHLCETTTMVGRIARCIGYTLTPATFPLYMEIIKSESRRAWNKYNMIVIPGVELSKNTISSNSSAHIIGLGINAFIHAHQDVVTLARLIRKQGGLAIAAHPTSTSLNAPIIPV
jgi:predicted metal-dependent phosphoesterase TrpH